MKLQVAGERFPRVALERFPHTGDTNRKWQAVSCAPRINSAARQAELHLMSLGSLQPTIWGRRGRHSPSLDDGSLFIILCDIVSFDLAAWSGENSRILGGGPVFCKMASLRRPGKLQVGVSHLRQLSRTSLDKLPMEAPRSPDTVSSNSTVRDVPPARKPRLDWTCTASILETITRDEVLLNLELFHHDIKPGMLMAIDVISERPGYSSLRKQPSQDHGHNGGHSSPAPVEVDIGRRYLFFVKDMPKDLRARHPTVELFVAKHIADAFSIKKGCTVSLTPVSNSRGRVGPLVANC